MQGHHAVCMWISCKKRVQGKNTLKSNKKVEYVTVDMQCTLPLCLVKLYLGKKTVLTNKILWSDKIACICSGY